jgi:hypothetical protein
MGGWASAVIAGVGTTLAAIVRLAAGPFGEVPSWTSAVVIVAWCAVGALGVAILAHLTAAASDYRNGYRESATRHAEIVVHLTAAPLTLAVSLHSFWSTLK